MTVGSLMQEGPFASNQVQEKRTKPRNPFLGKWDDEIAALAGKFSNNAKKFLECPTAKKMIETEPGRDKLRKMILEIKRIGQENADILFESLSNDNFVKHASIGENTASFFTRLERYKTAAKGCEMEAFGSLAHSEFQTMLFTENNGNALIYFASQLVKMGKENAPAFFSIAMQDDIAKNIQQEKVRTGLLDFVDFVCKEFWGQANSALIPIEYGSQSVKLALTTPQGLARIKSAYMAIKKYATSAEYALQTLWTGTWPNHRGESGGELFEKYLKGELDEKNFIVRIFAHESYAAKIGAPLDALHMQALESADYQTNEQKRLDYLKSLSDLEVLGILLSHADYLYTTSNHLLLQRLKGGMKKGTVGASTLSEIFKNYDLGGNKLEQNLLFRAIYYDRLYGKQNSLVDKTNEEEMTLLSKYIIAPMMDLEFNPMYYYLLGRCIKNIQESTLLVGEFRRGIEKALENANPILVKNRKALEFLLYSISNNTPLVPQASKFAIGYSMDKGYFEREKYSRDGKLIVVEIFDYEETKKDWLPMTVNDVSKINGMKKNTEESASNDDEKKYVYETNDAKIILYAGADREKNADFARKILKEYGNVVLVFRGHSLVDNIPYNVFGNAATSEFCIFGNCGSDGSKSKYKSSNPDTDLRVVGNTSTGYGGTTNAMVRELLNTHEKREIREITDASVKRANENANRNQDASTVESWTDGDALLDYVYGTVTAPQAKK